MEQALGRTLTDDDNTPLSKDQDDKFVDERAQQFNLGAITSKMRSSSLITQVEAMHKNHWPQVETALDERDRRLNSL
jgi:DNA-directed RNA polymerase subunit beta